MHDSKPVGSSVNPDIKLVTSDDSKDSCNQQMYQAVVGSLLHTSPKTKPDIVYAGWLAGQPTSWPPPAGLPALPPAHPPTSQPATPFTTF